eukprot:11224-Chlamydomonas_euryale.AAC.3
MGTRGGLYGDSRGTLCGLYGDSRETLGVGPSMERSRAVGWRLRNAGKEGVEFRVSTLEAWVISIHKDMRKKAPRAFPGRQLLLGKPRSWHLRSGAAV